MVLKKTKGRFAILSITKNTSFNRFLAARKQTLTGEIIFLYC